MPGVKREDSFLLSVGTRNAAGRRACHAQARNRTRAKADSLVAPGATWADSPATLAAQVEIIFTMLARSETVEEAALGEDGFLSRLAKGRMWVDCSTVDPAFSRKMATEAQTRSVRFLGAPVTGSKIPAAQGNLIFWVGGDAADLETCRPLLECMGSKVVHCGGQGMGASIKMVMNQVLGTELAAFAEGLILGQSLGLTREVLFDALFNGPAAAPFVAVKRERIEAGNYSQADFALRLLQKDLHLASVSAYERGVAMPLTNAAKELYRLAIRDGHGDEDISAIYGYLARNQDVH